MSPPLFAPFERTCRRSRHDPGPGRLWLAALALVLGVLAGLGTAVLGAATAAAHATLQATTPEADQLLGTPPSEIRLVFDEPVEVSLGGIEVLTPDGDRLDAPAEVLDGGLEVVVPFEGSERGTYTVGWRAVSEDGHPISGSFVFHVGERTGAAEATDRTDGSARLVGAVGRWLAFAGLLVSIGGLLFAVAATSGAPDPDPDPVPDPVPDPIGGPGTGDPRPVGVGTHAGTEVAPAPLRRLQPVIAVAALLSGVGTALATWAQVAVASGRGLSSALDLVGDAVDDTRFGRLGLWRVVVALGLAVVSTALPLWRRRPAPARSVAGLTGGLATLATAALGTALVVLGSIAGHPWTTPARGVAVVTDAVHVVAAAAWAGGLVALLVVLPGSGRPRALARRFSALALWAVAAVVASGVVSAWLQLRSMPALWRTGYGRLLLAKVATVAVMVGLGWANRRRLAQAPAGAPTGVAPAGAPTAIPTAIPTAARSASGIRRLVAVEVLLAALVVALTALLVNRPPARDEASGPYSGERTSGDLVVQLTVDPARAGTNQVHLYFFGPDGAPAAVDATEVVARVGDVPPRVLPVQPVTPGHFTAPDAALTPAGRWQLDITAVRRGQASTVTFEVPVR